MRFLGGLWNFIARLWTPSTPTEAMLAAPAVSWVEADPSNELISTLKGEAQRAASAGKTPVVFLHTPRCSPSMAVKKTRTEPLMRDAFAPVHVIEVNIDSLLALQVEDAGMECSMVPTFYMLDEHGRPTGAQIDGSAWGRNTPKNMAPPLSAFFRDRTTSM
jgi:hypothetical protein